MRVWNDLSVFEDDSLVLFASEVESRQYCSPKKQREPHSEVVIMPPKPSWCMLWPDAFYRSILRHGAHFRREAPKFLAIEHLYEGVVYFRQDDKMYLCEPGDTFLMHPGKNNEFIIGPDALCRKSSLMLSGPLLNDILIRNGLGSFDVLSGVDAERFESMLDAIKEMSNSRVRGVQERLSALSYEMLQALAHRESELPIPPELESLLRYMEENTAKDLTLKLLAHRCGCSAPQLIRIFNRHLGMTPYRMLIQIRMRLAIRLLAEQRFSVKEVAARTGYRCARNFTTEFKNTYDITPKEWQRRGFFHPMPISRER